ncbi:hypothetical protein K432DRAFT_391218 [Lepidopterella palustris CBS 459.81]|uniref:Uncharacterized protein n=1 Tax=Lepidopterella palustris CBS 459.81 TaxID=1314670 RepID=A0A8E2EFB3_9PEZI|nr:hypothetical protein K432DRAFT_391218 [Lepidopterella palustris CBS 459.81]
MLPKDQGRCWTLHKFVGLIPSKNLISRGTTTKRDIIFRSLDSSSFSLYPRFLYTRSSISTTDFADTQFDNGQSLEWLVVRLESPEKLWRFLMDKKDTSGNNPSWRWEPWIWRDPRNAKVIERTISKGYFIKDLENLMLHSLASPPRRPSKWALTRD